jgi:tRNA nucleotidyltransferase (CCA-adding enzyme)
MNGLGFSSSSIIKSLRSSKVVNTITKAQPIIPEKKAMPRIQKKMTASLSMKNAKFRVQSRQFLKKPTSKYYHRAQKL